MWRVCVVAGLTAFLIGGCAAATGQQQLAEAMAVPSSDVAKSVTIKDDALETTAVFSTERVFQEKRGLMGIVSEDQFLRAFLDKKTGKRSYQVYVVLGYKADSWREPFQANFGTPLTTRPVSRASRTSDCKDKRKIGGCIRVEHVVFELPESEFRRVVDTATPADLSGKVWVFKLKTKDGKDHAGQILLSEFFALKSAMEQHRPVAMR